MSDLIPQSHGGALRPFRPGDPMARQAAAKGTSMRAVKSACRDLLAAASEDNMRRLLALCACDDPRVSVVAIKECMDRYLGRVGEQGLADMPGAETTLDHLTQVQRDELRALLGRMKDLTAPKSSVVIEGATS